MFYVTCVLMLMLLGIVLVNKSVQDDNNITGSLLTNYSYININTSVDHNVIAACATGLGPSDAENDELGGWYFRGEQITNGRCNETVIQSSGANISYEVGVINLQQCGTFTPTAEGVYTCTITNSSMMNQTMRLGVYLSGRGR